MAENRPNNSSASGRILIIDRDPDICNLLLSNLENEGFDIDISNNHELSMSSDLRPYRLIIIDTAEPDKIKGLATVRRIKSDPATSHTPVIICSQYDSEEDIVSGLAAGADDYVVKPFSLRVMIARVRSLLRRRALSANDSLLSPIITVGNLQADLVEHYVSVDGHPIALTRTEYEILILFMRNLNHIFTRNEIYAAAWPSDSVVSARAIDTNISRLRKKVGQTMGYHIVSRSGFGYGLMEKL